VAQGLCRAVGYDLVSLESTAETDWVFDQAMARQDTDWWIGLSDLAVEGVFEWSSGVVTDHRDWSSGQPNDYNGQDCVQLDNGNQDWEQRGRWGDYQCDQASPFVCEVR
jgi:hypothetical protein